MPAIPTTKALLTLRVANQDIVSPGEESAGGTIGGIFIGVFIFVVVLFVIAMKCVLPCVSLFDFILLYLPALFSYIMRS